MNYIEEISNIKKAIQDSDIVSFDIFDTLLLRNVLNPTDIFKIVEIEYYNKYSKTIDFYNKRIKAECLARKNTEFEDITFEDIYSNIDMYFGKEISAKLKNIEIAIEKRFIISNKHISNLFKIAKREQKKILLISDMYLSKQVIEEILEKNGYFGYDDIYVSSEIKKSKATGSIYLYIKHDYNINSEKWLHIGDNYQSDYKNALKYGIKAIYYQRLNEREVPIKIHNLSESIVRSIQINTKYCAEKVEYWYSFGIMYVFPIYFGLMIHLIKNLKGKDNIYFLSRDGYMPYQIYNKLKPYYTDIPEAKYIYASRRAYIYPTLIEDKFKAIDFFTIYNKSFNQNLTLKDILNNLEVQIDECNEVLSKYDSFNIEQSINDSNVKIVKSILSDLWNQIEKKLKEEKNALESYFIQEGLYNYDSINIFDIGWAGSSQKALSEFLNKDVYGYYLGTNIFLDRYIKNNSYGYAFSNGKPRKTYNSIINNVMMYELLFTAPEGSLKKFLKKDNKIIPILKYTQSDIAMEKVEIFQSSMLDLFDIILPYKEYITEITREFALSMMETYIKEKRIDDLQQFLSINNLVTIGESKDFKNYVIKTEYMHYLNDTRYYKNVGSLNLWRDAIIIQDSNGRAFNVREFERVYSIKNYFNITYKLKKIFFLFVKAIKHPNLVIKKLKYLVRLL